MLPVLDTVPTNQAPAGAASDDGPPEAARQVFLACLLYIAAAALVWLFFAVTRRDGGLFFRNYRFDAETIVRIVMGFAVFWFAWGWLWYRVKRLLLRRIVGLTPDELATSFASRMDTPFDLQALLGRHSERRIRIVDMITRRGRTVPPLLSGFIYLYFHISRNPVRESLAMGIQDNFLDAIVFSAVLIGSYYSSGFWGRVFYGAHARIMDGRLARANVLLIGTMWTLFKFVMIPIGLQLAAVFPVETYAVLFVFIWVTYVVSDALSEVVGALFGRQKLRVWGIGDVNRKSVAGTWACFLSSLAVCVAVVFARQLPPSWLALAVVVSVVNTAMELFSPRGTDDFTMATANALVCWGFGAFVY
jgi:dolichol kinase